MINVRTSRTFGRGRLSVTIDTTRWPTIQPRWVLTVVTVLILFYLTRSNEPTPLVMAAAIGVILSLVCRVLVRVVTPEDDDANEAEAETRRMFNDPA